MAGSRTWEKSVWAYATRCQLSSTNQATAANTISRHRQSTSASKSKLARQPTAAL